MKGPRSAIGIDLGGTNLRVGLVDEHGTLLDFAARPIEADADGDWIVNEITDLVRRMPGHKEASAVGIGLAGVIFPDGVIRREMVNLPGLDHYPLRQKVARALGKSCCLENDATLALLGEHRFGAGRGCEDILLLTLGTGIGGALLLGGVLRKGPHGLGCEVGILPFPDPTLDTLTPFEKLASPKQIMQRLGNPNGYLYQRAETGDPQARRAIDQMYRYLGWLTTVLHLSADFRLVILSGGLSTVGPPLAEGVQEAFQAICPAEVQFDLKVVIGALPPQSAGVIGAAAMCFEETCSA